MIVTGDKRCPPQISHVLAWNPARASAARRLSHGTALKLIYIIHLQKYSFRNSHRAMFASIRTTNPRRVRREIITIYCDNHTKRISALCGRYAASSVLIQAVHITTIWSQRVKQKHVHERIGCLVSKKLK